MQVSLKLVVFKSKSTSEAHFLFGVEDNPYTLQAKSNKNTIIKTALSDTLIT